MKKFFALLLTCVFFSFGMQAQQSDRVIKEEGKTVFKRHAYLQLQGGAAHTIGEAKFMDLVSPAAALNLGYKFSPVFGLRLGASGWQAKGGWVAPKQDYKFNYAQGNLDLVLDLGSLFAGFNPNRVVNTYIFGGGAYTYAFDNDEANAINTNGYALEYLWKDNKSFVTGRAGLGVDFRLSDVVSLNLEGNANILSDRFNSKKAGNPDWQINALAGIKINLGKTYTKTEPVYYEPQPVVKEEPKPAPKPEPIPVVVEKPVVIAPMTQNIFFKINSTVIRKTEEPKIAELVDFLNKYPEKKVAVTGYADVDTGNARINRTLSEGRAKNVASALKAKGISVDRIFVDYKGDTVQPFNTPAENRVSICITD